MEKHVPPMVNARQKREIVGCEEGEYASLDAWARFKHLFCKCLHNGPSDCV